MKHLRIYIFINIIFTITGVCYANNINKPDGWGTLSTQLSESAREVVASQGYSLAISDNNHLYEWGRCEGNQIVIPRRILKNVSHVVKSNTGNGIGAITCNNELYLWGVNLQGLFGYTYSEYPVKVLDNVSDAYINYISVIGNEGVTFEYNVYIVNVDGELVVYKRNNDTGWEKIKVLDDVERVYGGGDENIIAITNTQISYIWSPQVYLESIEDTLYKPWERASIKSGDLNEGRIAVGYNEESFIINGMCDQEVGPINLMDNVKGIESNSGGFIALTYKGDAYVWGDTEKLLGTKENKYLKNAPIKILSHISAINIGELEYYFVDTSGKLKQLEFSHWDKGKPIFYKEKVLSTDVKKISGSKFNHELILLNNGEILSGKGNNWGEMGIGYSSNGIWNDEYVKVKGFVPRKNVSNEYINKNSHISMVIKKQILKDTKLFTHNNTIYVPLKGLIDNKLIQVKILGTGDYKITDITKQETYIFDKEVILAVGGRGYIPIRNFADIFKYSISMQDKIVELK